MSRLNDILESKDIYINGNYMVICKGDGGRENELSFIQILHLGQNFQIVLILK